MLLAAHRRQAALNIHRLFFAAVVMSGSRVTDVHHAVLGMLSVAP